MIDSDFLQFLRKPRAPRVLTTAMIAKATGRPSTSVARLIARAQELTLITQVRSGLFLNALAYPRPRLAEAAGWVRTGAVVSLHTVLGDAGVMNNPTPHVFALLPMDAPTNATGEVRSAAGASFIFRRMPARTLVAGAIEDRLEAGVTYLRATPEKALLDWLYLGRSPRSALTPPPAHDIDIEMLDRERLERLALAMGLSEPLADFINKAAKSEDPNPDSASGAGMGMGL